MAKQQSTRSAAPRPKPMTVEGVRLTGQQAEEFRAALKQRESTNGHQGEDYVRWLALEDVLVKYRPSTTAKHELHEVFRELTRTGLAAGSLHDWPFHQADHGKMQLGTLRQLAQAVARSAGRLRALESALRAQYRGQ